ncbi:MAG TPA: PrgI family protein [Patescibacteria group bacterium]|nr:PrgI family protein [Patescibacteria group bacterium]
MDTNHPIPQDVTGFQFKLIGSMTVKQFAYLAAPCIIAWLFYYAPGLPWLLKFPLMIIFVCSGLALAFLPIGGRPMDVMIGNFIHAFFSPNQYLYNKQGVSFSFSTLSTHKTQPTSNRNATQNAQRELQLEKLLYGSQTVKNPMDAKEIAFMQGVAKYFPTQSAQPSGFSFPLHLPKLPHLPVDMPPQVKRQEPEQAQAQSQPNKQQPIPVSVQVQPVAVPAPMQPIATPIPAPVITPPQPSFNVAMAPAAPAIQKPIIQTPSAEPMSPNLPHVSKIPKPLAQKLGLPNIPDSPNLITGLVRDPRGNVLSNILVEVKDKESNPVRAFKTNQLGQFASATSLVNGTYTITFEDPAGVHKFDTIEITAKGEIILPISIVSHDAREELRKALFN